MVDVSIGWQLWNMLTRVSQFLSSIFFVCVLGGGGGAFILAFTCL